MVLAVVLAALLGVARWVYLNLDQYRVTALPCGGDRRIIITAETFWERSQPLYYQVVIGDQIVVSKYTFYHATPDERLRFSLVSADDGEVVGVVSESRDAHNVLILHDFRTGESWPSLFYNGESDEVKRRLRATFDRLKAENPSLRMFRGGTEGV